MVFDPYYLKPSEYKGVNYFVQSQNMDTMLVEQLMHKEKSLKGMYTTEEFKALVLGLNADVLEERHKDSNDPLA